MKIGYHLIAYASSMGAVVYIAPTQEDPKDLPISLTYSFDCAATLLALQDAINALQRGDGVEATGAVAEAFARLAFYHKS